MPTAHVSNMVASAPADQSLNDDDEDEDDDDDGGGGGGNGDEPTTPSLMDHGSDPRTKQDRDLLTYNWTKRREPANGQYKRRCLVKRRAEEQEWISWGPAQASQ
ncbi:hypothetical protein E4U43_004841, partial [Claviceps pusilla]